MIQTLCFGRNYNTTGEMKIVGPLAAGLKGGLGLGPSFKLWTTYPFMNLVLVVRRYYLRTRNLQEFHQTLNPKQPWTSNARP